ncbi:MAG: tetratricopeptide repeat protein [Xanthomonadales bacterium]|nr:tetratricopeptide repeat protein [Xanthomonadales bacterium]
MDIYDQHEQGERVRSWLKENGGAILTGVVVGIGLIFGWQQWQNHKLRQAHSAAELYQYVAQAEADPAAAEVVRQQLRDDFPRSGYAVLAALAEAQSAQVAGDLDGARDSLEWADKHNREASLDSLIKLRLARLELAAGKADNALALVDQVPDADYGGLRAELRGDALLALGRSDQARAAYLQAQEAGVADPARLEMKLAEFPSTSATATAGEA